ncbi:MAG: YggS family pyridoxal phosphate-dependent enzyme [Pseudomonadota bacterium]
MLSGPQNSAFDNAIADRLAALRQRMSVAAEAAGRDVRSITLLAVTKGQSVQRLRSALALGLTAFGENYLPEALPKIEALRDAAPQWHFIGRLQANKTRPVAEHFSWVHSVDRLKVAERLSVQRAPELPPLNLCIQVSVSGEIGKGGVPPGEAVQLLRAVAALPRLRVRGLMCMLPFGADPARQRGDFMQVHDLLDAGRAQGLQLDTLSMGMSDDLEQAVAAGSTLLRIGTALFGPRA